MAVVAASTEKAGEVEEKDTERWDRTRLHTSTNHPKDQLILSEITRLTFLHLNDVTANHTNIATPPSKVLALH